LNFYVAPASPAGGGRGDPYSPSTGPCVRPLLTGVVNRFQPMTGDFAAAWLPSVFVPLVGIGLPAVAMALLFNVIEARD
jgi:photosystem I subunit 8